MSPRSNHLRVGLALSGGGARGLSQLGVLRVLEREGVPVDLVAGTSIGAIIGGLYACHRDVNAVEERVLSTIRSTRMDGLDLESVLRLSGQPAVEGEGGDGAGLVSRMQRAFRRIVASQTALRRTSLLPGEKIETILDELFEGRTFADTAIPFAAVAADVAGARPVFITSGSLAKAVAASSAIAGIFPPVAIGGRLLIDGGYTSPVPIDAARALGANVVVAVDVSRDEFDPGTLENGVEVAMRSSEISLVALEREQLRRADIVIAARGVPRHWSDYSRPGEAIASGEAAAEGMIDTVRATLHERERLFL
jgi:NTE family protein